MAEKVTPSQTALFAAAARAAHSIVDPEPHLLHDETALLLCKAVEPSPLDYQLAQPGASVLAAARLSACVRSNFAEKALTNAGVDQIVVVGAGLDTLAFRLPEHLQDRVWVIDRPGVLRWRSKLFDDAGVQDVTRHIPIDIAEKAIYEELQRSTIDLQRPIAIVWLGVSMYLEAEECRSFFSSLSKLAPGSHFIFDYHLAPDLRDIAGQEYASAVSAMAGQSGEPWKSSSDPGAMESWLAHSGWQVQLDIDEASATPDDFFDVQEHLTPMRLVRLVSAKL
ncbi:class I SAM-dependent methyltransferase [Corynebacterium glyciniphilum]|uniref:class I SAM-dependent methyltransferase n=1 Tax=Corynebacterium glyciniphilum TaxID=1404244 RepID=UPI003DA0ED1A